MENYSHHHDNGNVLNRASMDISLFNTNLPDEKIDIDTVNRDKKFRLNLVIWGKFYEDIYGWQANFESPGRGA